jgi:hypothetical protein
VQNMCLHSIVFTSHICCVIVVLASWIFYVSSILCWLIKNFWC